MMLTRIVILGTLGTASLALTACGGGANATNRAPVTSATSATSDPTCPLEIAGTTLSVEDTASGAAFLFATTGDAAQVQARATALADAHNQHHGAMGALPDGTAPAGDAPAHDHAAMMAAAKQHDTASTNHTNAAMGTMISTHSKALATATSNGARVEFVVDPANVGNVQAELRMHASHLTGNSCVM